jgi:ubiquinone/menaquinone biosynthesis C-methylase UbiE
MSDGFTLEHFAQHPFYLEVNRRLVALTGLRKGQCVVDLGAGTGRDKLIAEEVASKPTAEVIAVEPSETALSGAPEP